MAFDDKIADIMDRVDKTKDEIGEIFEEIGIVEMTHLDMLMHAITDFGGVPRYEDSTGNQYNTGNINYSIKLKDMLNNNIQAEQKAIEHYNEAIKRVKNESLKDLFKRLAERELSVEVTDEVKDYLAKDGYSEAYGARPLRRLIQRKIEDMLAEEILSGKYAPGDTIKLTLVDDKITFEKAKPKKSKAKEEPTEVTQ